MTNLLFPGRHLLHTASQAAWLEANRDRFDVVIFAITSANHQHTRYNPLPFFVRAIGADRLARRLDLPHHIFGIPHYRPTDRFARHTIQEIEEQTEGHLALTPDDTVVLCCSDGVRTLYEGLGFTVEHDTAHADNPQTLLHAVVADQTHAAGAALWRDFPHVLERARRLFDDPLLDDGGSLTATRDYSVYVGAMSNRDVIQMKYREIAPHVREGRIVDEGCADGALLVELARDLPDSDLIGIEITGEFLAQCLERQRRDDFGQTYAHFHQRNLFHDVFEPRTIDTTICNSTLHELWSYGEGEETVRSYLARKFEQTRPGGRIVMRDVVAPEDGDRIINLWCDNQDGAADGPIEACSTAARFERFATEFHFGPLAFTNASVNGRPTYRLRLRDAVEFMTKKDYTANWASEMHETFAFWSFTEWCAALRSAGFSVVDGSRVFTNPWIVEHRWAGRVALFDDDGALLSDPPTTMILVGARSER